MNKLIKFDLKQQKSQTTLLFSSLVNCNIYFFLPPICDKYSLLTAKVWKNFSDNDSQYDLPSFCLRLIINFLFVNSFIWSYAPEPLKTIRSDWSIFFLIAIVASVLNSDVLNSEGNKSSTNAFNVDFNSRQ